MRTSKHHHDGLALTTARATAGNRGRTGHTLVEAALATTLLLVLIGGTYTAVKQSGQSWGTVMQKTQIQADNRESIRRITEELKQAGNIAINQTNTSADIVTFQLPLSITNGEIVWGATKHNLGTGEIVSKANWWLQYRVVHRVTKDGTVDRVLVRRILDSYGNPAGVDEVIARHVDVVRDSRKGFAILRTGDLYAVHLRLLRTRGKLTNTATADGDLRQLGETTMLHLTSTVKTRNWSTSDGFVTNDDTYTTLGQTIFDGQVTFDTDVIARTIFDNTDVAASDEDD